MSGLLTSSRLKSARACQRLHRIEYELGYRPAVEPDALRFGTLFHAGLEAWWMAPQGERLEPALTAIHSIKNSDPYDLARAEVLLAGYDTRWADEPYEVLRVEEQFECDLRNPGTGRTSQTWRLAGKVDAIVRDLRDGLIRVVEHKTSSENISPGSEYWRRLRMDGQVSVYFEGARSLGFDVGGCLYDVIGKPGIKPFKATPRESRKFTKDGRLYANQREVDETPDEYKERLLQQIATEPSEYFQRGEVARLDSEMDEALFDIWQLAQQIRESEIAGRAPRNPESCVRYGRTCPYFEVCCGAASLDDPLLFKHLETKHPELVVEETPKEMGA